jgi:pimeloyl-ACP methyl ester carboxylesterase
MHGGLRLQWQSGDFTKWTGRRKRGPMVEPIRRTVAHADGEISYLEWENSGPALHFAHATGFNAETYRSLLQPLSDRFHIYASDARGHGLSSLGIRPGLAGGWAVFRDDLLAFLQACGAPPAILAGHSMGAISSIMAASVEPERVRALALIEPVLVPAAAWRKAQWKSMLGLQRGAGLAERAAKRRDRFESSDAAFAGYRGRGAFATWPDEMLRDYLAGGLLPAAEGVRLACGPWWEAEVFRSTPLRMDRLAALLRCPITLLYGGQSDTCPEEESLRFARKHGRTRRVRVAKATHFLPMEYPDLVDTEILRIADTIDLLHSICPGGAGDENSAAAAQAASFILEK